MNNYILTRREGRIVILTMNEPDRMNPFSVDLRNELIRQLDSLQTDESCGAIVLTGAGGHFCAGGDIRGFVETSALDMRSRLLVGSSRLMRMMIAGNKPLIAAVEGNCYGAGISLAAACDHFVVDPDASLSCAFIRMGLVPDLALMWTLPQRVGMGKARELMALARRFDGAEAFSIRLADRLSAPGKSLEEAITVAEEFAQMPPVAMAMLKGFFAEGLDEVLRGETVYQPLLAATTDHAEARNAFLEKRKPHFSGT
ncbi:crotonase/enoyl-CoA hydratase family protein (plasmid) [Rhizobium gallicum]|uniref:Crotonase/enoyl-CoA hydratase family protein n=1 Tax=Rhizobium gallicum TaxID=56730 RepID=A0A1L5NS19_9HYPH|nr:enoyl-CoA hydratase/isomerase family protein [Rhizobium gallicum]APO70693.1 crotonase/enoyl-CoA hydratase family protein [Rhizobium gallicum]